MNLLKRFIALLMCAAILVPMAAFAEGGEQPADIEQSSYKNAIELALALGIMEINGDWEFLPESNATRAELARAVAGMLNLADVKVNAPQDQMAETVKGDWMGSSIEGIVKAAGEERFNDVSSDHDAYSAISIAVTMGVMSGMGDGSFQPNRLVTYREVMTAFVRLLGYETLAVQYGGYPGGYVRAAQSKGLDKYVKLLPDSYVTKEQLASIICVCMETDISEPKSFGGSMVYETVKGKTLFSERFDIYRARGIVTATDMTGLYSAGADTAADEVRIDGDLYKHNGLIGVNMLARRVSVYYREDEVGDRSLVYVMTEKCDNEVLNIKIEDFVRYENNRLYYTDENESEKRAALDDDIPVICNGVYYDILRNIDIGAFKAYSAELELLDCDGDGRYDTLFVNSYKTYVVRKLDTNDNHAFVTDVTKSSSEIVANAPETLYEPLDLGNGEVNYRFFKDGVAVTAAALREDYVLSVGESMGDETEKWVTVYISSDKVNGLFSAVDGEKVFIDDKEYRLVPEVKITLAIGSNGMFYVDAFGRVAAFSRDSAAYDYGFFITSGKEETEDNAWVRIFTKRSGIIETISTARKVKVNTTSVESGDLQTVLENETKNDTNKLIAYKVDKEGAVKEIVTPTVYKTWTNGRDKDTVVSDQVIKRYPIGILSTYTDKDGTAGPGVRKIRKANRTNFADFLLEENGIIFDLSSSNTEDWCVKTGMNNIINTRSYDCAGYNIGYANLAGIMVMFPPAETGAPGAIGDVTYFDDKVVVITEAKIIEDENGDLVYSIKGQKYGASVEYRMDYERGAKKFADMNRGDAWQLDVDTKNRVVRCSEVFNSRQDWDNVKTIRDADGYGKTLGIVKEVGHNALVIGVEENVVSGDADNNYLLWTARLCQWGSGSTHVAWYDANTGMVEVKSVNDIYPNDLVFVSTNYGVPEQIIVIKR